MTAPVFKPRKWIRCANCKREFRVTKNLKYCPDCVKNGYKNI